MTVKELTAALGIEAYPANLENYSQTALDICDTARIRALEEKYGLLKEYTDFALRGAEALKQDPLRHAWGNLAADYLLNCPYRQRERVPFLPGEDLAADALHLLILLPLVEPAMENYRKRGLEEDTIQTLFASFYNCTKTGSDRAGRPLMTRAYFYWLTHYTDNLLFRLGVFNFELAIYKGDAIFLKNDATGEAVALMTCGKFHRSGRSLGSTGLEDEEGSFEAVFTETDTHWSGYITQNALVKPELHTFSKTEWRCILKQGQDILGIHIPKGADFSPEAIDESLRLGQKFVAERYPDFDVQCLHCSSWLLDPTLKEILGENSKIVGFQERFLRFPKISENGAVFGFVFQMNRPEDLTTLPEDTRLQRAIKERYLRGDYIYNFPGIIVP